MKIKRLVIKRYRSILDLDLVIDNSSNYISICGQNNSGKTNVLRAIELFFHPNKYEPKDDAPSYKYYGTRGGSVFPNITITFLDDDGYIYVITRDFDINGLRTTTGYKILNGKKRGKLTLSEHDCNSYIERIKFYFIESINISIPSVINDLVEDLFDAEYGNSSFRGANRRLKSAFDDYIAKLYKVLGGLAADITPRFREFHNNWGVTFSLDSDIKRFRDLISNDIVLNIVDGSKNAIDAKGAGLQRLAYILLHIIIIQKLKLKNVILLIDEPDVFLHPGLQKKLHDYLQEISKDIQVFVTTHSKIFIDTYNLRNVFLLEIDIKEIYSERVKKNVSILSTNNVHIAEGDGVRKIMQYLGIDAEKTNILENYNIIVEGESDRKYLTELMNYFNFPVPNIISAAGADNIPFFLSFYDGIYSGIENKPDILVLVDNDSKGREVGRKIYTNLGKYHNINVKIRFTPTFSGFIQSFDNLEQVQNNNEIEDFIYPSIICFLINKILRKKGMNLIDEKIVCSRISKNAYSYKGILDCVRI